MSLQRFYQLDKNFAEELDRLLHDNKFVDGLLQLPEGDLIQLINYLADVGYPPAE